MPASWPASAGSKAAYLAFGAALLAHVAASLVGWRDIASVEQDFREAQTALSTHFIVEERNYSLAYPTPVLGKPWSIPMEFPLYQWTVARIVEWTGWPLIQTGRGVSLACFYLTLPAWYLLLGWTGVAPPRRLGVLLLVLACPVYLHFSRSFLIESMALFFASWHAWAVVGAIQRRHPGWLAAAWLAGVPAALVKVTTWAAVILPCALLTLWSMATALRRARDWRAAAAVGGWGLLATVPAFVAGLWWVRTADAIKARNPGAEFLNSGVMMPFNFGTASLRASAAFWEGITRQWSTLFFPAIPLVLVLLLGLIPRSGRGPLLLAVAGFFGSQLLFPHLYLVHDYYFYANGFLLAGALGLVGVRLLDDAPLPRFARLALWLVLLAAGPVLFARNFLPRQRLVVTDPTGLAQAVQAFTQPDHVVAIFGQDWSSILPFAVKRRALAVPAGTESDDARWRRRLAAMDDERVAASLVVDSARGLTTVVPRRLAELGMLPHPLFVYEDRLDFYLRRDLVPAALVRLRGAEFAGVRFPPARPVPAGERAFDPAADAAAFMALQPFPQRYSTPYGVEPWFVHGDELVFLAHAGTWLRFDPPPDASRLRLEYGFIAEAFAQHGSDGVELVLAADPPDGSRRELWRRRFNPRDVAEDRAGGASLVPLPADRTPVTLQVLPGPDQNPAYDWFFFRLVVFE